MSTAQPDTAARFERLFHEHYPRVLAYARRRAPAAVADDVAAETFAIAWNRLEKLPGHELPWLLAIARRVMANQRRRDATQDRIAARAAAERPPRDCADASLDPVLARALARLAPADRELLQLIAWDGLTPAEAAHVLGRSAASARVRLHRARRRLAALLTAAEEGRTSVRVFPPSVEEIR